MVNKIYNRKGRKFWYKNIVPDAIEALRKEFPNVSKNGHCNHWTFFVTIYGRKYNVAEAWANKGKKGGWFLEIFDEPKNDI
jgi:hypothetical protein